MEADVKSKYLVSMGDKKHISFWFFVYNNGSYYSKKNIFNKYLEIKQNKTKQNKTKQ
jgi:hypothetical protein